MNWKGLIAGLGLGFAAGYLTASALQQGRHLSSDQALQFAKQALKDKGEITGSWIHMVPESIERYDLSYDVYRGGITVLTDGRQERFEFLSDAKTGTILEVVQG